MVAVLLSYLHPTAHRTDGAGGDGGRDVSFPGPDGLEVFELKSFTGRMTPARWTQVKGSLARAAQLTLSSWHLVVPIDFTPGEEARFGRLSGVYGFPCDYFGLTWLNAQMALYPVIPRSFLQGAAEKMFELLKEIGQEQAALAGGAPDLVQRVQRLSQRADELDPFYRFSFSVDQGRVSLALIPRYPGAAMDRPVTVTTSFAFPDNPEGRGAMNALEAAIRYGSQATVPAPFVTAISVDAPAGFGGEHPGGEIFIKGAAVEGPDFKLTLVLFNADGARVGSLPLTVGPRTVGIAGLEAMTTDPSGSLRCKLRVDTQTMNLNLRYEIDLPPCCLPALALPTITFLSEFGSPNSFQLLVESGEALMPATAIERPAGVSKEYVELIAAFQRVQERTHTYFDLPDGLTYEDYRELMEADRLTQGQVTEGRWTGVSMTMEAGRLIEFSTAGKVDLLAGDAATLLYVGDFESRIAGHVLPLGTCTQTLRSAVIENIVEVKAAWETDPTQKVGVRLRPGATDACLLQLGTPSGFVSTTTAV
jgi:hypothetical protein